MQLSPILELESTHLKSMYHPFFGCYMQQSPFSLVALNRLLNFYNFNTIIELGTHDAGLSTFFALYAACSVMPKLEDQNEPCIIKNSSHHKQPKTFFTFDRSVRDSYQWSLVKSLGANIFQADFIYDEKVKDFIKKVINNDGKTLLLCDGDKVREFNIYSDFLKSGDIIMCHDFAFDYSKFQDLKDNNSWYGCEVTWDHIKESCERNNIKQIHQDVFDNVAWFCGIKE
jgi:cephalosporin hydroxylase